MIVKKPYTNQEYAELAAFCNDNGMVIKDKGDYLESVLPTFSEDEKKFLIRAIRNQYLIDFVDPYQLVFRLEELSEKERNELKDYRYYLLDYTKTEKWWEQNPLTFEEWKESN